MVDLWEETTESQRDHSAMVGALEDTIDGEMRRTPFGAQKTAELDVQFSIDASYGLTRQRYGWYSEDVLFDSTNFIDKSGSIGVETQAVADSSTRIRSAYAGRYVSHTLAEPGLGVQIPAEHIERTDGLTSLTHGEISAEIVEWDDVSDSGISAHGISFEADGTYAQVRKGDQDIEFTRQENWNLDTLDGSGDENNPSGILLQPENGLVYNFPYTWYGQGALFLAIQDPTSGRMVPVHRTVIEGDVSLDTPNLPIQLTLENKGTADSLQANLGGMQFATHGAGNLSTLERGRETDVARHTPSGYIDQNVVLANNEPDPFTEPGRPLVAVERNLNNLQSRVSLSMTIGDVFVNGASDVYLFVFDEFDATNALTGQNFRNSNTAQIGQESRIQVDTEATEYTPSANATLRSIIYAPGDKRDTEQIIGRANTRVPIDSTVVVTGALPPGDNATDIQPIILTVGESY